MGTDRPFSFFVITDFESLIVTGNDVRFLCYSQQTQRSVLILVLEGGLRWLTNLDLSILSHSALRSAIPAGSIFSL